MQEGIPETEETIKHLKLGVRKSIGAIAVPDFIVLTNALPKTRSGKIMRRLLRKVAQHESSLGDSSTLADHTTLDHLIQDVQKYIPKLPIKH